MHIVIAHFNSYWTGISGGVEKVTCELANELAARGHKITILYRDAKEGRPYFSLDKNIETHNILYKEGKKVISDKIPVPWRAYREFCRLFSQSQAHSINTAYKTKQYGPAIRFWLDRLKPDIIISSSLFSTAYLIDGAETKVPIITMIHDHPDKRFSRLSKEEINAGAKSAMLQILLASGLPTAHKYFPDANITVIGNAIYAPEKMPPYKGDQNHLIILVGSYSNRKNQKLLVEAFGKISSEFPDWKVELWGDSSVKYAKQVEEEIHKFHLEKQVLIKGTTRNVWEDVYSRGTICAVPSQEESFGISLGEAMMMGIPAVGRASCYGVNELIVDGKTGILTGDKVDDFAEGLRKRMSNEELRRSMGLAGQKAIQKYNAESVYNTWNKLIQDNIR